MMSTTILGSRLLCVGALPTRGVLKQAIRAIHDSPSEQLQQQQQQQHRALSPLVLGAPTRAVAGLAPATVSEWAGKARIGGAHPVVWENPGAYVQTARVPDPILAALPPPKRPLWPVPAGYHTWRYLRSFSFALAFVALAFYLHARGRERSTLRLELERRVPWLASALIAAGIFPRLDSLLSSTAAREAAFRRVFTRFADGGGDGSMPLSRTVVLLSAVRGDAPQSSVHGSAASLVERVSPQLALWDAAAAVGASQRDRLAARTLSRAEFVQFALASSNGLGTTQLYFGLSEGVGVAALSLDTERVLGELFDAVVASRSSGASFSPSALAGLCEDLGFHPAERDAAEYLEDCAAAAAVLSLHAVDTERQEHASAESRSSGAWGLSGLWAGKKPAAGAPAAAAAPTAGAPTAAAPNGAAPAAGAPPPPAARLTREQFVDFCAASAARAEVDESKVADYVRVFKLLHLSGLKEAAGIR